MQAAFIAEQVPQCGYCLNGWVMTSVALLEKNPQPSDAQIREALVGPQVPLRHPRRHPARRQARGPGLREAAMTIRPSIAAKLLAGAGALVVSVTLPGVKARAAIATSASRLPLKPEQLATYISVNADGSAVGWIGKVDMGQGTDIGWAKMVAEELDLPAERVSIVQGTHRRHHQSGRRLRLDRHLEGRRGACAMPRPKRAACWSRWRPRSSAFRPTA